MNKVTKKNILLIFLLLIVALMALTFRFGIQPCLEKTSQLESENKELDTKVKVLKLKVSQKDTYEEGIKEEETKVDEMLGKYGAYIKPEKSLVMIRQMEQSSYADISSVSFFPETLLLEKKKPEDQRDLYITTAPLNYTFQTDYQGLKDMMSFITNYQERMNVNQFTITYDQESGELSGTMTINLFSVITDKSEYKEPVTLKTEIGSDNIFHAGD